MDRILRRVIAQEAGVELNFASSIQPFSVKIMCLIHWRNSFGCDVPK